MGSKGSAVQGVATMLVPASRDDLIDRLEKLAMAKTGDPIPSFLTSPNGWGDPLSQLAKDALAEILRLRGEYIPDPGEFSIDEMHKAQEVMDDYVSHHLPHSGNSQNHQ
jgi:hypothetical protein